MTIAPRRGGFVLIMVLVVILLASMVAASLLFVLGAEHTAAAASEGGEQAWSTAMSGVYQAISTAADPAVDPVDLRDNPTAFRHQLVVDDSVRKWYFSVYSPPDTAGGSLRFGLTDEASRINIYQATAASLETLPGVTPPLAQAILAALPGAAGPAPATNGGTATNLDSPFAFLTPTNPPNPRWTCLDELLEVPGVTPSLLYGTYSNLTGRVLLQTNSLDASAWTDPSTTQTNPGLNQLLTVTSYDLNQDSDGKPRLQLNDPGVDLGPAGLPAGLVDYLAAVRAAGGTVTNPVDLLYATNTFPGTNGANLTVSSGITPAELPALLDHCTTTNATQLGGLVNLNTASASVLAALPGMTDALAQAVVAARAGLASDARKNIVWLLQDGILNQATFQQIAPCLTTRSYQYHFFAAAYAIPAANYRLFEVVIDVAAQPPAILMLRDVTRLGLPFDPAALDAAIAPASPASPAPSARATPPRSASTVQLGVAPSPRRGIIRF